ncbi:hypothetical protein D3C71_2193590 [compost metagenome]
MDHLLVGASPTKVLMVIIIAMPEIKVLIVMVQLVAHAVSKLETIGGSLLLPPYTSESRYI